MPENKSELKWKLIQLHLLNSISVVGQFDFFVPEGQLEDNPKHTPESVPAERLLLSSSDDLEELKDRIYENSTICHYGT